MPDQPAPVPVQPRVDPAAGDMATLEQLGLVEPQPEPSPEPPPPPLDGYDTAT